MAGAIISASSLKTFGLILSGPAALWWLSSSNLFRTPFSVILIGGILGVSTGSPEGFMKLRALLQRDFSDSGCLGENTDWNCLFSTVAFPMGWFTTSHPFSVVLLPGLPVNDVWWTPTTFCLLLVHFSPLLHSHWQWQYPLRTASRLFWWLFGWKLS